MYKNNGQDDSLIGTACNALFHYDPLLIPFLLVYFYAGLQTWRLVMVTDIDSQACELRRGIAQRDPAAYAIFTAFLLGWPLFMLITWAVARGTTRE